jgi:hypothetical protein
MPKSSRVFHHPLGHSLRRSVGASAFPAAIGIVKGRSERGMSAVALIETVVSLGYTIWRLVSAIIGLLIGIGNALFWWDRSSSQQAMATYRGPGI